MVVHEKSEHIVVLNMVAAGAAGNNANKKVIFKKCAPFTGCISKINNAQVDSAKDIDVLMPVYNLIDYSDDYSKNWGSLWKCYRDEPALNHTGGISDYLMLT